MLITLQDWSNLAQVIGAIAVVISLFYVGFQIKGTPALFAPPQHKQSTIIMRIGI